MSDTFITVCGRLTADPLVRLTREQAPFCVFRIATSNRVRVQPGTYEDGPASFYDITAFNRLGANVVKSLVKGDPVVVTGRLRMKEYDRQDGSRGVSASVSAMAIGPDLTWGQARLTRISRPTYGEGDPLDQPEVDGALAELREEDAWPALDPQSDRFDVVAGPTEPQPDLRQGAGSWDGRDPGEAERGQESAA